MKFNAILFALLFGYSLAQNVVEVAVGLPNLFSELVDLVVTAGLDGALSTTQDVTVFAPTNDAFDKLHEGSLNLLKTEQWRSHLQNLLLQHVIPAEVPSSAITDGLTASALNGEEVKLNLANGGVVVNNISNVIQADVEATNGVIHVVDTVLFPEWVSTNIVNRTVADPELTIVTKLVSGLHLTEALSVRGPYTIFAPTDEAFLEGLERLGIEDRFISAHLAAKLLINHIVHGVYSADDIENGLELMTAQGEEITFSFNGDVPQVNGENIVDSNILANNGVIHKIDGLLIPKSIESTPEVPMTPQTVVDVAISNSDSFSSLVDFVVLADLVTALSTTQGITLFAPTNDAFAALANEAPGLVSVLQTEEWSTHLQDILLYHVLPTEVPSSAVTSGLAATTLNGEDLLFDVNNDGIFINTNSEVVLADVGASNGIIHAIDNVLIPSWVTNSIVDRALGSPLLTILVDLVTGAGLVETLSGEGPFTVFAPTNDAFLEFLGEGADDSFLDPELVSSILTYHVVPGIYSASDVAKGASLTTVQGEDITSSVMGNTVMVNGEIIVTADILAYNGIVHVIDGVLIPKEATAPVLMQESLPNALEQSTLSLNASNQSSASSYQSRVAAIATTIAGLGVVIAAVF